MKKYKLEIDKLSGAGEYYSFDLYVQKRFLHIPYWSYVARRTSINPSEWTVSEILRSHQMYLEMKSTLKSKQFPKIIYEER